MSYRARLLAIVGLALAATALATGMLIATIGPADAAQRVILVGPDGAQHDCGSARTNKRGDWVWRVEVPCGPIATPRPSPSPSVTPRLTASPSVTLRPTATANGCLGGCIVWDPASDTVRCVRPCR